MWCYAECHCAKCTIMICYSEYRAKCRYAECRGAYSELCILKLIHLHSVPYRSKLACFHSSNLVLNLRARL
jgi:hypothetical protein